MRDELSSLTIAEVAKLLESRTLSPVEYVDVILARIDEYDPQVNAFVALTADAARKQARRAEAEIMAGRYLGPLHGIPFAVKDVIDTEGVATSAGSKIARGIPTVDAPAVRRLREAGAILVGKVHTHEFAHGGPSLDLPWPPPRNPWDLERFTGGSSSGAGAALAARFVPAALGTDTGGSIRGPASFCGIVGLMPSPDLVSRAGIVPYSATFDTCGPMSRTVEDAAIVLQAIVADDGGQRLPPSFKCTDYRAGLSGNIEGIKVGVVRHYWEEDLPGSPSLCSAMDEAIGLLRRLGAKVETCRLWPLQTLFDIRVVISESEIYAVHHKNLESRVGDFGRDFLGRILPACLFRSSDYILATHARARAVAAMDSIYGRYDILLTAGFGRAPKIAAHRTTNFWQRPNVFTPANAIGAPSLALPVGFDEGLPLGMQIIGRPLDEATILRVGHAYQQATDWHTREPRMNQGARRPSIESAVNEPTLQQVDERIRDFALASAQHAGLALDDYHAAIMLECAPYALAMAQRIRDQATSD
jgi:aspartyl-tRNA(Asn)/glutamyl-tRNA(Gln) amidotransferase subunit A